MEIFKKSCWNEIRSSCQATDKYCVFVKRCTLNSQFIQIFWCVSNWIESVKRKRLCMCAYAYVYVSSLYICALSICVCVCVLQLPACAHFLCLLQEDIACVFVCVCIILLWLNYGFLISKSINICVCSTDLAVKAAPLPLNNEKSSAYEQNRACLQILEKDRDKSRCRWKWRERCERGERGS